jgi:alpha-ketoglutarate-dependent taurine dioxygenase
MMLSRITRRSITPIDATLGAVVTNLDLSRMDPLTWKTVEQAFHEHGVLVFPAQHLSAEAQVAFANRFGCTYSYFTSPVDISALVSSLAGFTVTETSVPRTGVSSDDVKRIVNELAVVFFRATLEHKGERKLDRYLDHKLVDKYGSFIEHVEFTSSHHCGDDDADDD